MEPLVIAQLAATAAATAVSAAGAIKGANTSQALMDYEAQGLRRQADETRAVSQAKAAEQQRKTDQVMGEQRARFASSGGGVEGSALGIMGDTAKRGKYLSDLRLWEGEQQARGIDDRAVLKQAAGDAAQDALPLQLGSTILQGASSMMGTAAKSGSLRSPSYYFDSGEADSYSYDAGGFRNTVTRYR